MNTFYNRKAFYTVKNCFLFISINDGEFINYYTSVIDSEDSKKFGCQKQSLRKKHKQELKISSSKPDRTYRPQFRNEDFQHGFNPRPPSFFFFQSFKQFTIYSKILAVVVDKQDIGAVDALKRTKTNIEAEGKFNLDCVCSEDDLNVNKKIFDHKNSKISNTVLKTKSLTSKLF